MTSHSDYIKHLIDPKAYLVWYPDNFGFWHYYLVKEE